MPDPMWLPWCVPCPIPQHSNGPFTGTVMGLILHVNESTPGTSDAFYAADPPTNPNQVTPNFQVYPSGETHQYAPLNYQTWTVGAGNNWGPAVEVAGYTTDPMNPAELAAVARIMAAVHELLGVPLQVTDSINIRGLGTHGMGGNNWGHPNCPGPIRAAQRAQIIALAAGALTPTGGGIAYPNPLPPAEDDMTPLQASQLEQVWAQLPKLANAAYATGLMLPAVASMRITVTGLAQKAGPTPIDTTALATQITASLVPAVVAALAGKGGLTDADVQDAVRTVLGSLDEPVTT